MPKLVLAVVALGSLCATAADEYVVEALKVPMRDGTLLATDVYRPAQGSKPTGGNFPVLVTRSPYNKNGERGRGAFFAQHGYVFVAQDCRGFFASDGKPVPFVREGEDTYDTIEWAAGQSWSNGKVGTTGASYLGMNQLAGAIEAPPHLLAIYAAVAPGNYYDDAGYRGGIPGLGWPVWLANSTGKREIALKPEPWLSEDREKRSEIFADFPTQKQAYWDFYEHPNFDAFWRQKGFWPAGYYKQMKDVPMFFLSGWYDNFCDANIRHFRELSRLQKTQKKLVIGPWPHGYGKSECGDASFGRDGDLDERAIQLDWFDHWLTGAPIKVVGAEPIRYYRIGPGVEREGGKLHPGGEWRTAAAWPLPATHAARFYLHQNGALTVSKPGEEKASTYAHDPQHLVPTIGGRQGNECIQDQHPLEGRSDVLTFLSEPLKTTMDVTGNPRATIWTASDAPEADFILRLADIFPNGYAMILSEGQVRMRSAGSATVELGSISKLIGPGHRIGLFVMSSSFPKLEPLPRPSRNTVYHDGQRASWLELPVIPE